MDLSQFKILMGVEDLEELQGSAKILADRKAEFDFRLKDNQKKWEARQSQSATDAYGLKEIDLRIRTEANKSIIELMDYLERVSKTSDRNVEVYADPDSNSYYCRIVPAKKILPDGTIMEDKLKKTFLIGVPASHIVGMAPRSFLHGEILHEQGHAEWTNFQLVERCSQVAREEGYNEKQLFSLLNSLEDSRMERLKGGRMHVPERKLLFEKNSRTILPSILGKIDKCSPVQQFIFLIKLERIWQIHRDDWATIGVDFED